MILWLLAHGERVWQASLALLLALGLAAARRHVRRAAARDAGARRARLGAPAARRDAPETAAGVATELREGAVTLAGRLEIEGPPEARAAGEAVTTVAYLATVRGSEPAWETIAEACAGRLALVVPGGERVAIAGPVEIVVGAREARLGRVGRAPAPLRCAVEAWHGVNGRLALHLRSLSTGDEVWAAGVLERVSGEGATAYRDRPIRWRIGPARGADGGAGQARVALAFAGVPRPSARALLRAAATHVVAASLVFLAIFGLGGELAFHRLAALAPDDLDDWPRPEALASDEAILLSAVAAATPFRAWEALHASAPALDEHRDEEPAGLELLAAMRAAEDGDGARAAVWMEHGQLERGAALAERSGAHELAAHAWYVAGDFERASLALDPAGAEVPYRDPLDLNGRTTRDLRRFRVQAHLLAGRLEPAAAEARRLEEALAWVALPMKGPPSAEELEQLAHRGPYDVVGGRARCLADALDARRGDERARERLAQVPPGVAHRACAFLLADLLEGDARRTAIAASSAEADAAELPARWLALLSAEGAPEGVEAPDPGLAVPEALSKRVRSEETQLDLVANGGDGHRLRTRLRRMRSPYVDDCADHAAVHGALRVLAPTIDRGREDLLRWIRRGRRTVSWACGPLRQLAAWTDLAAAAEALGDASLAGEMRARAERFHRALTRRDIAVPLAVLEGL